MVNRITNVTSGPVAVSRALPSDIKELLLDRPDARELPCIRGRTVVPAAFRDTLVVGWPNHLGVFDTARADRTTMLTSRWSGLRPTPEWASVVALEDTVPQEIAAKALADARKLVKDLRQLKGVRPAIRPQSPIVIVLLPFSPGREARLLPGMMPLDDDLPEYPGGIRIEMPLDATGLDVTRYAASLRLLIAEEAWACRFSA